MFLLPNQKKIDEDSVIDAMLDFDATHRYVLDTTTGEVGCIEKGGTKEKPLDRQRYIPIPKISSETQLLWLKECVEFCLNDNSGLRAELMNELQSGETGSFERCEKLLSEDESGWIHGWREWQGTSGAEALMKWLPTLPFEVEDKFEGCGDCELCKLMEQGEHTLGDFLEAKQKEERKAKAKPTLTNTKKKTSTKKK